MANGVGRPPPLMSPASGSARRSALTSLRRPPDALGGHDLSTRARERDDAAHRVGRGPRQVPPPGVAA